MSDDSLVILGNGGAGIAAVTAARSAGFAGDIHMMSDTTGPAFNPMLAPYYLKGAISWERCFPFGDDFYQKYKVECHFGIPVASIDTRTKHIVLEDTFDLHYGKCLIATGAQPVVPPVPGLRESKRAFPLRTAAHTKSIENIISGSKGAVVMGASLVGVKLAEIFRKNKLDVTLIDIAPHMLPRGAHPKTAAFLEDYFRRQGIDMRMDCGLSGVEDTKNGIVCTLPDAEVQAGFVAVCAGIRPNMSFLKDASLSVDQAICVDEHMRTSVKDVFAAGDVCQGNHILTQKSEWLGTWGNARLQGRTAGLNMAGRPVNFFGNIPQHISPFFDWDYAQIGDVGPGGNDTEIITKGDPFKGAYYLLAFKNDVIIGANLINCTHKAGIIRHAILKRKKFQSGNKQDVFMQLNAFA